MKRVLIGILAAGLLSTSVQAGNPDRAGQAGATQLLINPWARSSGMGGLNQANIKGIESFHLNVAGLAFTQQTEMVFSRTNYLKGADININNFGFSQKVGSAGAIGLAVMSMDLGENQITTVEQPDGGLGTFTPRFINVGLGYSKAFSNSIYGGILMRVISESITDVKASGICLDAGVMYVTSLTSNKEKKALKKEDTRFGISIRNIGPDMSYGGAGLATTTRNLVTEITSTTQQRSASFNLPSLVNIGVAYDLRLDRNKETYYHKLTLASNFTSNTFSNNQYGLGFEYGFKNLIMVRSGYVYEKNIMNEDKRMTFFTGFNAGATVEVPVTKNGTTFGIDYSYRATKPFNGVHSFGARINLGSKKSS